MKVTITEKVEGKVLDYETEDGKTGRVDCGIDGTMVTAQGLINRLGADEHEIHFASGAKAHGRTNPDSRFPR